MSTLNQSHVEAIATQIRFAVEDGAKRFTIEPGRGATYSSGNATLYAHSRYGRDSVLSGQSRRIWIEEASEEEGGAELLKAACTKAGVKVDCSEFSSYQPPSLSHLPGEDDPQDN